MLSYLLSERQPDRRQALFNVGLRGWRGGSVFLPLRQIKGVSVVRDRQVELGSIGDVFR